MINDHKSRFLRRTFLTGVGATAAGTLLRPLISEAAVGPPARLLIVHRPCGTRPELFFPTSTAVTGFPLSPLLMGFQNVQSSMTILNQVTCPRVEDLATWPGDLHGQGLITMMTGKKTILIPGTPAANDPNAKTITAADKSIDQVLAQQSPSLMGTTIPSIQLSAFRPSSVGLPVFRVMSYSGSNGPLFPESRPDVAFASIFGQSMAGVDPATLAHARTQKRSVLDFMLKDMTRLKAQVPSSQRQKLDAHLAGIQQLETELATVAPPVSTGCVPPTLAPLPATPAGFTIDEAQHDMAIRQQFSIIKTAFQCDLTRVATFTFAHGNSTLRFTNVVPGSVTLTSGHHDLSHELNAPTRVADKAAIDKYYCDRLADLLNTMKATPEGTGTMLDNTLVVFFSEVCIGELHSIQNMPVVMFGGQALTQKLRTGQHLRFANRFMTDVWVAVANAFGVPLKTFGDSQFNAGPVAGLFA
jgi:Protein of unknown function (DUF1552)